MPKAHAHASVSLVPISRPRPSLPKSCTGEKALSRKRLLSCTRHVEFFACLCHVELACKGMQKVHFEESPAWNRNVAQFVSLYFPCILCAVFQDSCGT